MTIRYSANLLVLLASWLSLLHLGPALQAQPDFRARAPGGLKQFPTGITLIPQSAPSYQPLQDDPHDFRPGAEWEVQGRLQAMQQLQELQKNARQLARDPELVNKLRGLRPDQIEELRRRLESGEQLNASPQMQELFKKLTAGSSSQPISRESVDALRNLIEKPTTPPTTTPSPSPTPDNHSSSPQPGPGSPASAGTPMPASGWDRFQEDAADWVRDNLAETVERWQGASEAQAMRDLLSGHGVEEGGFRYRLAEQAQGLSGHLPRLDLHVPRLENPLEPFRSLWTNVEPPRLGGFSSPVPRVGTPSTALGDWAFAILFGLLGVLLLFLMGRQVQLRRVASETDEGEVLGPWPVAPAAVSTRQQLVRAFDYLALMRLGLQARSCHHLEVAAQLGRRGGDLAHEQAAESLARLYEQARYAPVSEPLGPEELAAARRHLCFLAGVIAS